MNNDIKISSASVSDRGLSEKRPENEDSFLDMPRSGIFAVADGVGGAQAGEVASQMAVEILGEAFANLPASTDAETAMRAAIERANTAIFQMAHELPQLSSMATTIAAVHLDGNIATIGHVGDSRVYRVDREGDIFRETDDHSMVAEEVRAGRMTEEQAENHPSRNIISRALGAEATVEPDLKTIMVEPGTAFLVCSDGVTRHVGDQEIRGVLTFGGSPEDICDYVKNLCMERGAEDNFTAVVVKLADSTVSPDTMPLDRSDVTAESAGPFDSHVYVEEPTVATARIPTPIPEVEDDDILTIDVEGGFAPIPPSVVTNKTIQVITDEPDRGRLNGHDRAEFSGGVNEEWIRSLGTAQNLIGALLMLVVGGAVGIGIYHFMFVRPQLEQQTSLPPITEMQTRNQQLSAFEENRRTVDLKPTESLAQFGSAPSDAEDFYLVGRAQLLLGQYNEAKRSFTESRARIAAGDVDPANRKTLENEIAISMAVLNDTTVQGILRSQLGSTQSPANTNSPPR